MPRLAGAFCALGMLLSDVRHDFVRAHLRRLDSVDASAEGLFADLERQGAEQLAREGFAPGAMRFERSIFLRYLGQQSDVCVPAPASARDGWTGVRQTFEREHERLFGHHQPGGLIEITKLRLTAVGVLPRLRSRERAVKEGRPTATAQRQVYVDAAVGWREVDVFAGAALRPGQRIEGPAIVEEATTTVLIGIGDRLQVDPSGNFHIALGRAFAGEATA